MNFKLLFLVFILVSTPTYAQYMNAFLANYVPNKSTEGPCYIKNEDRNSPLEKDDNTYLLDLWQALETFRINDGVANNISAKIMNELLKNPTEKEGIWKILKKNPPESLKKWMNNPTVTQNDVLLEYIKIVWMDESHKFVDLQNKFADMNKKIHLEAEERLKKQSLETKKSNREQRINQTVDLEKERIKYEESLHLALPRMTFWKNFNSLCQENFKVPEQEKSNLDLQRLLLFLEKRGMDSLRQKKYAEIFTKINSVSKIKNCQLFLKDISKKNKKGKLCNKNTVHEISTINELVNNAPAGCF